jgi:hypothetical protein
MRPLHLTTTRLQAIRNGYTLGSALLFVAVYSFPVVTLASDFDGLRFVNSSNERVQIEVREGRALETGSDCATNPRIDSRTLSPGEGSPAYRCGVTGNGMCLRFKRARDSQFSDWSGQSCGGWYTGLGNVKTLRVP